MLDLELGLDGEIFIQMVIKRPYVLLVQQGLMPVAAPPLLLAFARPRKKS